MGKGAVTAAVVNLQIPDNRGQQDDGRIGKKIALLVNPRLIEVQKRDVGTFIGVGNVVHEAGVDGIAAVRLAGIVEVDDAELRFDGVFIQMMQQMVVGDARQVVEFVVVDKHRETFFDVLLDVVVQYGEALAAARSSENLCRPKRIDDIDPSLPPCSFVTIARRKVDRAIAPQIAFLLKKTLILVVERIVGKRLFEQAPRPYSCGQQAEIPDSRCHDVTPGPEVIVYRKL